MSLGLPEWPEVGDFVIATVKRVESYGAYVTLDEYGEKEGLLHISEISSRWVRNIRNHVRPGQKVVLQVLRIDQSKDQIDLSLRRVNKDEKRKKLEDWKKARKAETLVTQAAYELRRDVKKLYDSELVKMVKRYGSLYEGLEEASKRGKDALIEAGLSDDVAEVLTKIAKEKISIRGVTIQGVIEITSFNSNGVEDIKTAFINASDIAEKYDASINVTTMGAPRYRIELTADDYKKAELGLDKVVSSIRESWKKVDGAFAFKRE